MAAPRPHGRPSTTRTYSCPGGLGVLPGALGLVERGHLHGGLVSLRVGQVGQQPHPQHAVLRGEGQRRHLLQRLRHDWVPHDAALPAPHAAAAVTGGGDEPPAVRGRPAGAIPPGQRAPPAPPDGDAAPAADGAGAAGIRPADAWCDDDGNDGSCGAVSLRGPGGGAGSGGGDIRREQSQSAGCEMLARKK